MTARCCSCCISKSAMLANLRHPQKISVKKRVTDKPDITHDKCVFED
jgi:hypothetical protein